MTIHSKDRTCWFTYHFSKSYFVFSSSIPFLLHNLLLGLKLVFIPNSTSPLNPRVLFLTLEFYYYTLWCKNTRSVLSICLYRYLFVSNDFNFVYKQISIPQIFFFLVILFRIYLSRRCIYLLTLCLSSLPVPFWQNFLSLTNYCSLRLCIILLRLYVFLKPLHCLFTFFMGHRCPSFSLILH